MNTLAAASSSLRCRASTALPRSFDPLTADSLTSAMFLRQSRFLGFHFAQVDYIIDKICPLCQVCGMMATTPVRTELAARRSRIGTRGAALIVVALLLIAAHQAGLFGLFADPARATQAIVGLGPWGFVAFVVAYAALQPFGVSGTLFVIAATLIWPWPLAFGVSMVGTMAASVVGFSLARFVARDWVATRVPARFRAHDEALVTRGFRTVVLLRLVFTMQPMLHAFLGISRVSFRAHFWGSVIGYIVPLAAITWFGEKLFEALRGAPPAVWIGLVGTILVIAIAYRFILLRGQVR
jgi:uncharacterized membrane protein YdjX (TVP38/TMEM64 family)